MIPTETFATDAIPQARRVGYWNDVAVSTFGDIAVAPLGGDFAARLQRRRIGKVTIADIASAPARVEGGGSRASSSLSDGWFLLLNERGSSRMSQCGREVHLRAGELTLLRADQRYRIEFERANRTIVLHAPGTDRAFDLDAHVATSPALEDAALLVALMRKIHRLNSENGGAARLDRLVADLAALCWPESAPAPEKRSMPAWERLVKDYVERSLADPSLNAASIAGRFGVSARFIHKVFARAGQTASAYILERRLALAAERLRAEPEARITDVALDAGFTDLSYFCRRFRARFGASAGKWRDKN